MNKQELVSKIVEALRCYYSPMVMIGNSIDLAMIKAISYLGGGRMPLSQKKMDHLNTQPYIEEVEDICFGLTIRLFEIEGTYVIVVGQPSKDEWYDKALVVHKQKVDAFPMKSFKRPETH